ncbi:unnamed protein product [Agarophyton chilense]
MFRCAIDLRPVNDATVKQAWPMPHLDSEILGFAGSKCFAVLDLVHGYWQLPFHPESYIACGVVCPDGTYYSTWVIPGLTNAAAHFQSSVEPLFKKIRANLKAWLDDLNLFTKDEKALLRVSRRFWELCKENNLMISAKKSTFFAKEIKWCGRLVNGDGYTMDPANVEGLRDMHVPQTADELYASNNHWAGVVTQTSPETLKKPFAEQKHEPLAFLGNTFKDAQTNWSTYEQEDYAIVKTFDKLDYLFMDEYPVHVFTDHRNLLFVFAPTARQPSLGQHVVAKIHRWAIFLSRFEYIIEHIPGKDNVFADILTRWLRGYRVNQLSTKIVWSLVQTAARIPSPMNKIEWPGIE